MKNDWKWKLALVAQFFPPLPPPSIPAIPVLDQGKIVWSCDFEGDRCGMIEQSKTEPEPRSFFVGPGRTGDYAIALFTQPGDSGVHGSGSLERDDLELPAAPDYCNDGQEEWWAVSVLFPDAYVPSSLSAVMDFHHDSSIGNANFHVIADGEDLWFDGYAGDLRHSERYFAEIGPVVRNAWYDFVYHVKWSSRDDGFMVAWVNGKRVLERQGKTLYTGLSCYLKLANYHEPTGYASVIVYDRLIRGTSASAVALEPLE